ncbi:uncharacterized protein [Antedon mediterranea]|uniref:uncharacterized protein isoform X1 n=1 Tax=Antedon mediterranea TaxID=105859 RepID=UPI003AF467BA
MASTKKSGNKIVVPLTKNLMTTNEKVYRMLKTPEAQKSLNLNDKMPSISSFCGEHVHLRAIDMATCSRLSMQSGDSLQVNPSIAGTTLALLEAAEKGDSNKVQQLLKAEYFNVDYKRNEDFRTALHRGCQYGHTQVVRQLLKGGADPNFRMSSGKTLLHEACVLGHHDIVLLLLDFIQDVDTIDNQGQNACHVAAYHGENRCLAMLANKGADCALFDNRGRTPAHLAAQKNHPQILESLSIHGVDIETADENGKRPLHYAAMQGGLECLVKLIQCNCDASVHDALGCIAAHYASAYNHIECLRFLIKHGATFTSVDASGKTLAHWAAQNGATTTLHWLFEKGADPNIQDDNGNTAGHLAAANGHAKCFNCYLQHSGCLELTNKRDEKTIDIARRFGHPFLISRACSNDITCVHCQDKSDMINWEKNHQPTRVQRSMASIHSNSYKTTLPDKQKLPKTRKKVSKKEKYKHEIELPKRDLATRYFTA